MPPQESTPAPPEPRPGAILDRDGTLIDELGYLGDPEGVRLFPGAARAVRRLNRAGVPVALVTNQSGVARGLFTEADLAAVHARLVRLLAAEGAHLDLILHAPSHPDHPDPRLDVRAHWRKPEPGMVFAAAERLGLDLSRSVSIGDAARDLEAAARAGVPRLFLVETGKGRTTLESLAANERARTRSFPDLAAAVEAFLAG